jgi:hypothetical protein
MDLTVFFKQGQEIKVVQLSRDKGRPTFIIDDFTERYNLGNA